MPHAGWWQHTAPASLSLSEFHRMTEEFLLQETLAAAEWTCFVFYRGTW